MPRYRILHCLRAPVGGLFRHVRDLAREQSARGHLVGLVCDATSSDTLTEGLLQSLDADLALGITRIPMPREPALADLNATTATRLLASAMQANVLHGHGAKGGAYARLAASAMRGRGLPVASFYTPHGGSLHYPPKSLKGRLFMAAERRLARETDGILFESDYAYRTYSAHVGEPGCPVRVVHNGLRPDELVPVSQKPDAADFVFVGELRRLKGVDLLIEATERVLRQRTCRVVIVGAGPDGAEFRDEVARRSLGHAISFPGAMPARDAFRLGRALVMPSRAESLPYVALEAGGAGLPIIATDVGGVPEIVSGTDTALIPADDAGALADAMQSVLEEPEEARGRAERLRLALERGFSVAHMTDAVLSCYAEAAERSTAPAPVAAADRAA